MKILKILGVLFCTVFFTGTTFAKSSDIVIKNAWARASNTKTSAAYMKIKNLTKSDVVFLSASSDVASIVELHKTVTENNISQMVPINKLVIPAKDKVVMKPKGLHIMLIGLKKPLNKGSYIPLTLHFENMKSLTINVEVK